jgi:cyclic pyranopterin monophosphate synthase
MSGPAKPELSHFDDQGQAHMVDVSGKPVTDRVAVAVGAVRMSVETLALITEGRAKKGDVLSVARLAGIEMEALTAVSVAALTVYDMVKAVEKSMVIDGVRLILKDGGKSGRYEAQ